MAWGIFEVWLVAGGLLLLMILAREAGGWVRPRVVRAVAAGGETAYEGYILSAVLGLLAFLLGFTFNMGLDRYETRRDLVVQEANAISSAALRFEVLDEPQRSQAARMFATYAQTRLAYGHAVRAQKPPLVERSRSLRGQIEEMAESAVAPIRDTALASSILSSVIEVSDIGAEREAAVAATIPSRVITLLCAYMVASAAMLGFVMAGAPQRHRWETTLVCLLFVTALGLILDLDAPQTGAVQVSQEPMEVLVRSLAAEP